MKTNIQSFLLRVVRLVAFKELLPDTKAQKPFSCGLKGFSFKSDVLDYSIFEIFSYIVSSLVWVSSYFLAMDAQLSQYIS